MKYYVLILILILYAVCLVRCTFMEVKNTITQEFYKRTGEPVALDYLIKRYEMEHQKLYREETGGGTHLLWQSLDKKNLSDYCKKYLQHAVPGRTTNTAHGSRIKKALYYGEENTSITNIIVIRCKVMYNTCSTIYYFTRAPEPHCVYALKLARNWKHFIFTIINKHCNFEGKQYNMPLKWKKLKINDAKHPLTGQSIAKEKYLLEYELEHQNLIKDEGEDGAHLKWPDLDKKNLTEYCRKYLQHAVPKRTTYNANGSKIEKKLHYEKQSTNITSLIVLVRCKVRFSHSRLRYYITRAPKPNCVYALLGTGNRREFSLHIINKHCNFEGKPVNIPLKEKLGKTISMIHHETGQPIAMDKYLLAYELEHQVMLEKEGDTEHAEWPLIIMDQNFLNAYCHQYVKLCAPSRNLENVKGRWKNEKLHYNKSNKNEDISLTAIQCQKNSERKLNYYMARAPERNCVFALLRQGCRKNDPLVIIFKHCGLEIPNEQITITQDYVLPKIEVKVETPDTFETLQFFQLIN